MRANIFYLTVLSTVSVLFGGCATVASTPEPVAKSNKSEDLSAVATEVKRDHSTRGFRYYLPKPYLLLAPNEEGKAITAKVILLPDYERAYYISTNTFLATSTFGVSITNGLLQKVSTNTDTTGVPLAGIDAATEIAKARQVASDSTTPVVELTTRIKEIQALIDQYKALLGALPPGATTERAELQSSVAALESTKQAYVRGTPLTLGPLDASSPLPAKLFEVVATPHNLALQEVSLQHAKVSAM